METGRELAFDEERVLGIFGGGGAVEEEDRVAVIGETGELEAADGGGWLVEEGAVAEDEAVGRMTRHDHRQRFRGERFHLRGEVGDGRAVRGVFHDLHPIGGKLAAFRFADGGGVGAKDGEGGDERRAVPDRGVFGETGAGSPVFAVEGGLEDEAFEAVRCIAGID